MMGWILHERVTNGVKCHIIELCVVERHAHSKLGTWLTARASFKNASGSYCEFYDIDDAQQLVRDRAKFAICV